MRTPVHTRAQRFKVPASLARSPAGAVLAVAAGALVYAGVTGKAPVPDWLRARLPHTDERGLLVIVRAVTIQRARDELYASLLGKSQAFHDRQRVGDIMARATDDVNQLSSMMAPGLE